VIEVTALSYHIIIVINLVFPFITQLKIPTSELTCNFQVLHISVIAKYKSSPYSDFKQYCTTVICVSTVLRVDFRYKKNNIHPYFITTNYDPIAYRQT